MSAIHVIVSLVTRNSGTLAVLVNIIFRRKTYNVYVMDQIKRRVGVALWVLFLSLFFFTGLILLSAI